tara:strand:- start:225 stop:410 length:186 start_codon:yes stop_codon:yes gene_type:complete
MPHLEPSALCPKCFKKAKGYKQVNTIFGYRKMKKTSAFPIPQSWCKACRTLKKDNFAIERN